jgi:hypothetical protein
MSEARHQLLITLVHGTWGRGFFPARQRQNRRPFWFEEGSPFLARLSTELSDIPHKFTPLLWSGANSIHRRDEAAHTLAGELAAENAEHPQATQLVIAHSHGGNIALRALRHLQERNAFGSCRTDCANLLVVTLATPFIEVHKADFGDRPMWVRQALLTFLAGPFFLLVVSAPLYFLTEMSANAVLITCQFLGSLFFITGLLWIAFRDKARQGRLDALQTATRLGELLSAQRLLVIRAIDDEASLTLALGAILNYITARSIAFILSLYCVLWAIIVLGTLVAWFLVGTFAVDVGVRTFVVVAGLCLTLTIILLGILIVSRSVHGRELAVSPMECQINTQSTPDAKGLSEIITLVRRKYVKALRHGIYDHEDCAKTISDWLRSQLPSGL